MIIRHRRERRSYTFLSHQKEMSELLRRKCDKKSSSVNYIDETLAFKIVSFVCTYLIKNKDEFSYVKKCHHAVFDL